MMAVSAEQREAIRTALHDLVEAARPRGAVRDVRGNIVPFNSILLIDVAGRVIGWHASDALRDRDEQERRVAELNAELERRGAVDRVWVTFWHHWRAWQQEGKVYRSQPS